jgi:hypothetical protein
MDLPQHDQRPQAPVLSGSELLQEDLPIALHCRVRILFSKAKIEIVSSVDSSQATRARAESVQEPRDFL